MQNRCKRDSLYPMNRCYIIVKKNIELAVDELVPGTLGAMHLIPYCKIHCSISDSLSFQFLSLLINSQSAVSVTVGALHGMFFPSSTKAPYNEPVPSAARSRLLWCSYLLGFSWLTTQKGRVPPIRLPSCIKKLEQYAKGNWKKGDSILARKWKIVTVLLLSKNVQLQSSLRALFF